MDRCQQKTWGLAGKYRCQENLAAEGCSVFSNPRMSLKACLRRAASDGSFSGCFHICLVVVVAVECGNRLYRFPRFVGRAENSLIVFRAFHKPSFPRSTSTAVRVQADLLICSNMVYLACCICRAASVSLMVAATRLSAFMLSPGAGTVAADRARAVFRAVLPQLVEAPFSSLGVDLDFACAEGRW